MRASQPHIQVPSPQQLPEVLPAIELQHGEALWVLAKLGFQRGTSESTFREYIKSLRKLGTPFVHSRKKSTSRKLANYRYCHLMELALVLTLRVYHVVPDALLGEIVRHRTSLHRHYRRAYAERGSGIGKPIFVETAGHPPVCLRGAFLDLQIDFSGGKLVKFGPPKLLAPFEALIAYAERDVAARSLLPINLSALAEKIVSTALNAPVIRSGPAPSTRRSVKERHVASRDGAQAHS